MSSVIYNRRAFIAGAIVCSAAPAFAAMPVPDSVSDPVARTVSAVEAIVGRFMKRAGTMAQGITAPKVFVSFTPQLSWLSEDGNSLHTVAWSQCPPEFQGFIADLVKGADMTPEAFFTEVFNAFLVPHEMSHFFDMRRGLFGEREKFYQGEVQANRVAVAFWLGELGGYKRLKTLMRTVQTVLDHLPNPVPAGQDRVAYFNTNYEKLSEDAAVYGWYQFRMFLDAWDMRASGDFKKLLAHSA